MTVKFAMNKLIVIGIRDLKNFGYPNVNLSNILSDKIYATFFSKMLTDVLNKLPNEPYFTENVVLIKRYKSAIKIIKRKIQNNGIN